MTCRRGPSELHDDAVHAFLSYGSDRQGISIFKDVTHFQLQFVVEMHTWATCLTQFLVFFSLDNILLKKREFLELGSEAHLPPHIEI